jgi:glycosyltransferase involved in cell wall biosynthesis
MKLSIITICFNSSSTIETTIKSVLSQNYDNLEYIIIDGNSTDNTLEIIHKYRNRISKIISEKDNGIYDAMNKGVCLASGDVIGILNSDDFYEDNNVLQDVMTCFDADPELSILYGDLVYVKNNNIKKAVRKWVSKPYYRSFFENGNVPPHPTLFVKSSVYNEVGLFDLQYKLAADYEFMLRAFKRNIFKSMYINRLIVRMRLGGATNRSFINILSGNKEIIHAWKNNQLTPPIYLMLIRFYKRMIQFF